MILGHNKERTIPSEWREYFVLLFLLFLHNMLSLHKIHHQ